MNAIIKNIKNGRINQKEYIIFSISILLIHAYSLIKHIQDKEYVIATLIYLFWAILNAVLLRNRANDMEDFKNTNINEMNFSFFFGSVVPVLNLGIIFYYATSKSK